MTHSQRKPRGQSEIVVFGRRAVLEALAAPTVEMLGVRASDRVPKPIRAELNAAVTSASDDCAIEWTSAARVAEWSREPRHDQGVAARIRLLQVMPIDEFLGSLTGHGARRPARVVAFDNVTNPQNIGLVVRSAVAFGFSAVLWPTRGCPWIEGLVVKASASTVLRARLLPCETLPDGLTELAAGGFRSVGLAADAGQSLAEFEAHHRQALVLGSETKGLSAEVVDRLDALVRIDMSPGIESLNVAASAAVACYALGETSAQIA
ncbi:MAG: RNA methyltransferase [Planctomycetota bacterium]